MNGRESRQDDQMRVKDAFLGVTWSGCNSLQQGNVNLPSCSRHLSET